MHIFNFNSSKLATVSTYSMLLLSMLKFIRINILYKSVHLPFQVWMSSSISTYLGILFYFWSRNPTRTKKIIHTHTHSHARTRNISKALLNWNVFRKCALTKWTRDEEKKKCERKMNWQPAVVVAVYMW